MSIKCTVALCLKKKVHALIKNTVLLGHANRHLSLQQVIFLPVEGLALILMIADWLGDGCWRWG